MLGRVEAEMIEQDLQKSLKLKLVWIVKQK